VFYFFVDGNGIGGSGGIASIAEFKLAAISRNLKSTDEGSPSCSDCSESSIVMQHRGLVNAFSLLLSARVSADSTFEGGDVSLGGFIGQYLSGGGGFIRFCTIDIASRSPSVTSESDRVRTYSSIPGRALPSLATRDLRNTPRRKVAASTLDALESC